MTIYLYKKTHNKTGLQYLGKTTNSDPHKYKGSGEYWLPHIKKHGYDVTTEILKECQTNDEVKEWGQYYSKVWNVVDERDEMGNKTWANLKPEEGDGFASGQHHPMHKADVKEKVKKRWQDPVYRKNRKEIQVKAQNKPETIVKKSLVMKSIQTPELRKKNSEAQNRPEVVAKKRYAAKKQWHNQEYRNRMSSVPKDGKNNPRYDHVPYVFTHTNGTTITCTRYELQHKYKLNQSHLSMLVSGKAKTCKGWSISNKLE
jgi:hypothetical protein